MEADLTNPPTTDDQQASSSRPLVAGKPRRPRRATEAARDLYYDWVNEDDLEVFRRALSDEPNEAGDNGEVPQIERIRAVSDFAPIQERVRKSKGPKRQKDIVREGWAYHAARWPLLGIIFFIIFLQFLCYLAVRQIVNLVEWVSAWRGYRGKLRMALRNATTYDEWKERALALDNYDTRGDWKRSPPFAYYDSALIRKVVRSLRELREKDDYEGVRTVLEVALRSNFAGVESFRLYSETFYGTKELVEDYVARSVEFMREAPTSVLSLDEKSRFFRRTAKNLGATALCLSGGASFGYYHFGVVRALLDANLLPRVITGTSAGAIVAAFICTRTDDELKEMLIPAIADRITACEEPFRVWASRAWKTGARFDTVEWARKASFFCMVRAFCLLEIDKQFKLNPTFQGSMTFKEAYERTGRILNVSVIPFDQHSPTKLLNYLTTPDVVIYTAVIASAAVPGILNPVVLLTKDKDGHVGPSALQGKHKDGSLRVDIPLQSLHLLYNVNFSIVSQVNPHIHLFHFAPRGAPGRPVSHRRGKGWRGGYLLSAAEQFLKLELTKNFRFAGQNWSAVFLQKFEGTGPSVWDWVRILSDPDRDELARMMRVGAAVTWPKIKMIENRMKVERQLDLGREEVLRAQEKAGTTMHRESSNDILTRAKLSDGGETSTDNYLDSPDVMSGTDSHEVDDAERTPRASTSGFNNGEGSSKQATPAKRRQQILAKLGLKGAGRGGFTGGGGQGSFDDSDLSDVGRGRRAQSESALRRRFSMGTLQRAGRVKGRSETALGGETTDSDGSEVEYPQGGDGNGWSSAASNR
ncbi:patatin-like phospholipase domain containing protein [Pseudohyphozyma bogoriensis]|nr:patatin-like phospholipase domain containing protein [Pseudohyphozyma bogoriensis]